MSDDEAKLVSRLTDCTAMPKVKEALEVLQEMKSADNREAFAKQVTEQLAARMKDRVIIDGRNIFDRKEAEAEGFTYFGIGV